MIGDDLSARLQLAREAGMIDVHVDARGNKVARILAPPHPEDLSDDDWLNLMEVGSQAAAELRNLGYTVHI